MPLEAAGQYQRGAEVDGVGIVPAYDKTDQPRLTIVIDNF
jgi:hypothetical protein